MTRLPSRTDSICALSSPPGVGAIALIRIAGGDSFEIVDRATRRGRAGSCREQPGQSLRRAWVVGADGEPIDDVLLAVFHAPHSYTGDDLIEISCHGNPTLAGLILARLLQLGARSAAPGEFTLRAFLNGKIDLSQAEAVCDQISAQTAEAARFALRQGRGDLSRAASRLRDRLLGTLARIEGSIDFPEEVGELDFDFCRSEVAQGLDQLKFLLRDESQGRLLREGLALALAGPPNVGKSSLLNALLREDRALVSAIPGTTRDTIEESWSVRGIPLRLADTAGMRQTDDPVEQMGVERSRRIAAAADLTVLVRDSSRSDLSPDESLLSELPPGPRLVVWNKWDIASEAAHRARKDAEIPFSALTGWNRDALEESIWTAAQTASAGAGIGESGRRARHRAALEQAQRSLRAALDTIAAGLPADFLAIDISGALSALGEITGHTTPDEVIAEIFSRFCIGK